jgi:hypothetical protein
MPKDLNISFSKSLATRFDKSPNKRFNPDPTKEVHYGEQIWGEMMIGFFCVGGMNTMAHDLMFARHRREQPRN